MGRLTRWGIIAGILLLPIAAESSFAEGWKRVSHREGIRVWQRSTPGTSIVEFRAQGVVAAGMKKILAVLRNQDRSAEWMEACTDARALRLMAPDHSIMYQRTSLSVPFVSDRDVVFEMLLTVSRAAREVRIDVWDIQDPLMPPVDHVIRLKSLKAGWILRFLDDARTDTTFFVQADPGGWLPIWVVNLFSKNVPLKTIMNLRRQVKKGGYEDDIAYVEAAFDWKTLY